MSKIYNTSDSERQTLGDSAVLMHTCEWKRGTEPLYSGRWRFPPFPLECWCVDPDAYQREIREMHRGIVEDLEQGLLEDVELYERVLANLEEKLRRLENTLRRLGLDG